MTFDELMRRRTWVPIANCPGRFILAGGPHALPPEELLESPSPLSTFDVATARDTVAVGHLDDGGVISYRRADGSYVHTLNTAEGFARKLRQLGIESRDVQSPRT